MHWHWHTHTQKTHIDTENTERELFAEEKYEMQCHKERKTRTKKNNGIELDMIQQNGCSLSHSLSIS